MDSDRAQVPRRGLGALRVPAVLAIAASSAVALPSTTLAAGTPTVFAFTGGEETYTVPAGVSSVHVEAIGARGASITYGNSQSVSPGGKGALVNADIPVTPGQVLYLTVGGVGITNLQPSDPTVSKALGGGSQGYGGGGGGSWVRSCSAAGPCTGDTTLVVAGGGGGGAPGEYGPIVLGPIAGGDAGASATGEGAAGANAAAFDSGTSTTTTYALGGQGGTIQAGGAGGAPGPSSGQPANSGASGIAGEGGAGAYFGAPGQTTYRSGGGGGGGYFGGGGGGEGYIPFGPNSPYWAGAGGGGGSSFAFSKATNVTYATSPAPAGAQKITIIPADPVAPPTCKDSSVSTPPGGGSTLIVLNCSGLSVTYGVADPPDHGSATIAQSSGIVTYTPDQGFKGTDTFIISATSAVGTTNTTITVNVPGAIVTGSTFTTSPQPTPTPTTPPKQCIVPVLKGSTLKAATQLLTRGNCKLGTVKQPKAKRGKKLPKLVVTSQKIRAGSILAVNAKVGITLGPKPAAKKKTRG